MKNRNRPPESNNKKYMIEFRSSELAVGTVGLKFTNSKKKTVKLIKRFYKLGASYICVYGKSNVVERKWSSSKNRVVKTWSVKSAGKTSLKNFKWHTAYCYINTHLKSNKRCKKWCENYCPCYETCEVHRTKESC